MVSCYFDVWTKREVINDKQLRRVLGQICSENNRFWHLVFSLGALSTTLACISNHWAKTTVQLNNSCFVDLCIYFSNFITSVHPNSISQQPVLLAEGWPASLLLMRGAQSTRTLWFLREFNLVHPAVDLVLEDEALFLLQVKPNKGLVTRRSPMSPGQGPKNPLGRVQWPWYV